MHRSMTRALSIARPTKKNIAVINIANIFVSPLINANVKARIII